MRTVVRPDGPGPIERPEQAQPHAARLGTAAVWLLAVIAVILAAAALRATMLLAVPLTVTILLVCARGPR